jgi:hypothetical protein
MWLPMSDQDVDEPLARSGERLGQAAPSLGPARRPNYRARPGLALAATLIVVASVAVVVRVTA